MPVDAQSATSVCVCVLFPFILDSKFVGRTSRGHTGGRSHRISHPPSFCGACLTSIACDDHKYIVIRVHKCINKQISPSIVTTWSFFYDLAI